MKISQESLGMTEARGLGIGTTVKFALGGGVVGLVLLWTALYASAGGHGLTWPMMVLFPFAWVPTVLPGTAQGAVESWAITIAAFQFPVYAGVLGQARRRGKTVWALVCLFLVHGVGLLIPFGVLELV